MKKYKLVLFVISLVLICKYKMIISEISEKTFVEANEIVQLLFLYLFAILVRVICQSRSLLVFDSSRRIGLFSAALAVVYVVAYEFERCDRFFSFNEDFANLCIKLSAVLSYGYIIYELVCPISILIRKGMMLQEQNWNTNKNNPRHLFCILCLIISIGWIPWVNIPGFVGHRVRTS